MKLAGPVKSEEGSPTPRKQQVQRPWGKLRPRSATPLHPEGEPWGLQHATV